MKKERLRLAGLLQVLAVAAVGLTTRASLADQYYVPSGSMEPTVHVGDRIVVDKLAYGLRVPLTDTWVSEWSGPDRGDVVVLEADSPDILLKRVVAVAGDRVEVRDGHVRIDGKPVRDPSVTTEGGGPDFGPVVVPDNKLLVLGDNRGNSRDGRMFGWIDRQRVLGKAFAVIVRDGCLAYRPL